MALVSLRQLLIMAENCYGRLLLMSIIWNNPGDHAGG